MSVLGWIIFGVFALVFPWAFDRVCMYISKKTTKHEYGIEDTYEFYKKQYDEILSNKILNLTVKLIGQ